MCNKGKSWPATVAAHQKKSSRVATCLFGDCCNKAQLELTSQLVALVSAAAIGVGMTILNFAYVQYDGEDTDIGSWGSFFTTYATLFAIISGMVLANVLERFQKLSSVVEEELNSIASIRDMLVYLNLKDHDRINFLRALCDYLKKIADVEWRAMAREADKTALFCGTAPIAIQMDSDSNDELLALHKLSAEIMHRKPTGGIAVNLIESLIIPQCLELGKFRTNRLSLAEAQLPPRLKFLLLWMIFFLVIGFILMSVENIYINVFMTVAVTGAIQWLFTIITDLDHPFFGIWNMSRDQLDSLIEKFESQIEELMKSVSTIDLAPAEHNAQGAEDTETYTA